MQASLSNKVFAFTHFSIKRAFTVCTAAQLINESNEISYIARNNEYKERIINRLILNIWKIRRKGISTNKVPRYPHDNFFSGFFEKLKYKFNEFNICIIAKPTLKLKKKLSVGR